MDRDILNSNLITNLGGYAQLYQYTFVRTINSIEKTTVLLKFSLNKETLKNVIKVLYESEMDVGDWHGAYRIINYRFYGTIFSLYYFSRTDDNDISDILNFLMSLYIGIFGSNGERRAAAIDILLNKLQRWNSDNNSGADPNEIVTKIADRTFFDSDFFTIEVNVERYSYVRGTSPEDLILKDKQAYFYEKLLPHYSIEAVLNRRFQVEPSIAHATPIPFDHVRHLERSNSTRRGHGINVLSHYKRMIMGVERLRRNVPLKRFPFYNRKKIHDYHIYARGINTLDTFFKGALDNTSLLSYHLKYVNALIRQK
jgi:hypothetical protein